MRLHSFDFTGDGFVLAVLHPVFADLNVHHIALFEVQNLVGHAG